ncbi:MAG: hypothetical protein Q4F65_02315 [Propionibacteriaceae bacterium]|nr:hypothetical protein [Propionibacteriaceae bacterium]
MSRTPRVLTAAALSLAVASAALTGCTTITSGPAPEMRVLTCGPRVDVEVHNTDDAPHRYTVTISVRHDGMSEDVQASTDTVQPEARAVATAEVLGGQDAECSIIGVQAFPG